jgi:hypothetical protein
MVGRLDPSKPGYTVNCLSIDRRLGVVQVFGTGGFASTARAGDSQ